MTARSGRPETAVVRAVAPAKVNLVLEVLGRRPDGYHEVRTAMLALDLADRIEVRLTERGAVELDLAGPQASDDVPRNAENLAVGAAEAVLRIARERGLVGREAGLWIRLEKRIPSRSGLGGASSDAAASALASARALALDLEPERLERLLAGLGSDCVFFARAARTGFAWCTGRGEEVAPSPPPWPAATVAVLTPDVVAPTREVYAALGVPLSRPSELSTLTSAAFASSLAAARPLFFNRLEEVALATIPGLNAWREALDASGAEHFRLSGSGSSFFGLFEEESDARATLERIGAVLRARGLAPRGMWSTRPSSSGARLELDS